MSDLPHVTCSEYGEALVVCPVGEFDLGGTDLLRSVFAESITAERCKVVVDLSGVVFLDSMALGALIGAQRRAHGWGGWLRLVAPRPNIRKVLRLTEIDTVFGLYDTVEQAIGHQLDLERLPADH
ncbi:MAG: inducers of aerial mycelium formation biosynthesis protein bldG [Marmoricola sp.]|nr:inducers of aerial mycelium formation biosynthesis protein bldG [Marmoricola sp.]